MMISWKISTKQYTEHMYFYISMFCALNKEVKYDKYNTFKHRNMDDYVIVWLFVCGTVCYSATTVDPNMCGNGVCCTGFELDGDRCKECRPGRFGVNCSHICSGQFYGRLCTELCPSECNVTCDKVSGVCPKVENTTNNWQEDFKTFFKENVFTVVGVVSIFIVFTCCVGSICIYKSCPRKKNKRRAIVEMAYQNSQPSNHSFSVRYESNDVLNQISTSPQLPRRHQDNTRENGTHAKQPMVEYSKPKKRYSLVRKVSDSQNVSSCHWSDDSDDVFDSDEYDDCANNVGNVQVSGLPKEQSSFRVEGPPKQQSSFRLEGQAVVGVNGAYGNIWL